jgi:putative aldouronate transport system permease protein
MKKIKVFMSIIVAVCHETKKEISLMPLIVKKHPEARIRDSKSSQWKQIKKMKQLYFFLIIPAALLIIFSYLPMYGVLIAFKDFRIVDGIMGSQWNNFKHFRNLFNNPGFIRVFRNTINISLLRLLTGFPAPIILALLLNELRLVKFKKIVQTMSYLPYFMSWVVLGGIVSEFFSPQRGPVNYLLTSIGLKPIHFLTSTTYFIPILLITAIWQGVGWGSIIFLASLSTVNLSLYESADIDGANRFQKAFYISIPALIPVMTILFILSLGGILNAGFDQIFNLFNPLVYKVADIIDTYVYRTGLLEMRYDSGAAIGLFKTLIGVILIVATNIIIRRYSEYGIW